MLVFFLLINSVFTSAPSQNQIADAAWLSAQIYKGVDTLNTDSGCVIKSHQSLWGGAYAVWKHYRTKECYVVIRGTEIKSLIDILTDINLIEVRDNEIEVNVQNGVKLRSDFILGDIDSKLSECKRDIIITGHSLGGAVAHHLFLKYVYKHYYDWGDGQKSERFKAVLFGTPQLMTRSNNQFLVNHEDNINWYKYESDIVPEIIFTIKGFISVSNCFLMFGGIFSQLTSTILNSIKSVSYGNYIPGNKYFLWYTGVTERYRNIFEKNFKISDHAMGNYYNAIVINGWGEENTSHDSSDSTNCLRFDYIKFISEEGINEFKESQINEDDETINIDTIECEDVKDYIIEANYSDAIFYLKNDNSTYIIKRLLDNEKEYEYAICTDSGFVLKQCNNKCNCHKIEKNDRPKKIELCSSYQFESTMNCLIDGKIRNVESKNYFSLLGQTKIEKYYLMNYYCKNEIYLRGNYQDQDEQNNSSEKISISFILLLLILFSL